MMDAVKAGLAEPLPINGKVNPSDILTKPLNGEETKVMRQDLLGIKVMDKVSGVRKPKGK